MTLELALTALCAGSDLVPVLPVRHAFGSFHLVSFVGKFRLYSPCQLIIGRTGEDTVKLGAVIVYEADVFNDQVVDSPILARAMKFIVDTKFLSLGVPNLTTHLSIRSVRHQGMVEFLNLLFFVRVTRLCRRRGQG
jgi:hypothetical protein